jgi:hypothetical protein
VPSGDIRAIELDGGARRIVIDHVSAGWSADEIVSVIWVKNATIQWSVFAEGLSYTLYERGDPGKGKGMSFGNKASARRGRYARRVSVHHNLFASNDTRNPSAASACANPSDPTDCLTDVRNNVIYNWGAMGTIANNIGGHNFVNVIANVYKAGPDSRRPPLGIVNWTETAGVPGAGTVIRPFVDGNVALDREGTPAPIAVYCSRMGRRPNGRNGVIDTCRPEEVMAAGAHDAPPVTTSSAEAAYEMVLAGAGANVRLDGDGAPIATRDATDRRIVTEARNGGGRILRRPDTFPGWPEIGRGVAPSDRDNDGMPDAWEVRHGFDAARTASAAADADGDGYTDLEEYLNGTDPRAAE